MFRDRGIEIKTPEQIGLMRRAGLVVGETLEVLRDAVRPGLTTGELDQLAERTIRGQGAVPSFLGYGDPPFPATLCVSVNDEIVHGIPGERVLADGDVVSIDCGAIVEGWHGDAATTVVVGGTTPGAEELMRVTEAALWQGIAAARLGSRIGEISAAIEAHVRKHSGFGIVEEYVGHGIGSALHQPPNVPNVSRGSRGPKLVRGMALAVEPMVVAGSPANHVLADEWTVATDDGSVAAHFEHTITWTPDGAWVLTALDGGRSRLQELGVPYGGD